MYSKVIVIALISATAVICPGAIGADNADLPGDDVSLEQLVAEVLRHNPEARFYDAEIAAAKGELRTAGVRANPEVSAELGVKSVRADGRSAEGVAASISIQQSFEWPGRIELRRAIANRQIELAELGLAQFRAVLASKARIAAFKLLAAQRGAAPAREVAERFRNLREVLMQRDSAGLTATLETRIIEATEIGLQREVSQVDIEAQSAIGELNQLRGRDARAALHITGQEISFTPLPSMDALLAAARRNNFELRRKQIELAQHGLKVSLARNERYPAISVGPFLSQENAFDSETIAGAGISVPWPLWNRNEGNIQTARARAQQAQASVLVTQREVERKVVAEALRYERKLQEMSLWRPDSLHEFREAATVADRHYRLGAVPISTYVELQKQYLEAVRTLLDTKREALEAAQEVQLLTRLNFKAFEIHPEKKE